MTTELLEIQHRELKFTFELKKQSSCSILLRNKSDHFVAFKVKTTSPKKYCVRPNIGIIKPKATCDFTVTMQAQRVAPPDLQCKDKFLIQSTVVPFGITEEDITSDMFAKDSGKYIEGKKLRVILTSPPHSPVLLPINGELKQDTCHDTSLQKERVLTGVENITPPHRVVQDVEGVETITDADELKTGKDVEVVVTSKDVDELRTGKGVEVVVTAKDVDELKTAKDVESFQAAKDSDEFRAAKDVQFSPVDDVEELKPAMDAVELKLAEDFEELKLELNVMDSKLREAEFTVKKLTEERSMATQEKDKLRHELEVLRRINSVRRIQVGFPLLYVCIVALISLVVGYFSHSYRRLL